MHDEEASWPEKLRFFLNRRGGYEIVRSLLEGDKHEGEIVEDTGGPESTVHTWLHVANSVNLVEERIERVEGTVKVRWSIDDEKIPDEAISIIESRGEAWRTETPFVDSAGFTFFPDDHDISEALGLTEE